MNSIAGKLEKRFARRLSRLGFSGDDRAVIALSGGGDSVALLALAAAVSPCDAFAFHAVRVSHSIRRRETEESEEAHCRQLCQQLEVPFTPISIPPGRIQDSARLLGCGTEQAARSARYDVLERHRRSMGFSHILTGHTADDQLETVLMRLLSGSGPEGLKGIPAQREAVLRPLLGESREKLRAYLNARGLFWKEDATNTSPCFTRNRVRHELIPLLRSIFPGWDSALSVLGERSLEAAEALETARIHALPEKAEQRGLSWAAEDWNRAAPYLKALAIWAAHNRVHTDGVPDQRLSWKQIESIRSGLDAHGRWNRDNLSAVRKDGRVHFFRRSGDGRGRVVLSRDEALDGFRGQIGGRKIEVSRSSSPGALRQTMRPEHWPLIITFTDASGEPALIRHGHDKAASDADAEMFYISIETVEEGVHVRNE